MKGIGIHAEVSHTYTVYCNVSQCDRVGISRTGERRGDFISRMRAVGTFGWHIPDNPGHTHLCPQHPPISARSADHPIWASFHKARGQASTSAGYDKSVWMALEKEIAAAIREAE